MRNLLRPFLSFGEQDPVWEPSHHKLKKGRALFGRSASLLPPITPFIHSPLVLIHFIFLPHSVIPSRDCLCQRQRSIAVDQPG